MMVEVSYQMVLSTLQTVGLLVGIYYYIMVLRNQQKNQEISLRNQQLTLESQELTRKAQENALETRQASLFMDMYKEYLSERESRTLSLFMKMEYDDLEDFERKYGFDNNPEINDMLMMHMMLMEAYGVLIREGFISVRLVALLNSAGIRLGWETLKDFIYEAREKYNLPRWSIEYEYLYNTMMEYAEQHPELKINP